MTIENEGVDEPRDVEPSKLDDGALYLKLQKWFRDDASHSNDWRDQAQKDFDFRAGDQWETATKNKMIEEGRIPITFNRTLPIIKAIAGIEINTRHEVVYLPRGIEEGDIVANDALTQASKWMADGCNAEAEESQAFQDMLTCGMGWTEDRLDYEVDPEGRYVEEKLDPIEMYWDCTSRKQNISDSRRRWRARKMPLADARAMFGGPDTLDLDLHCPWALQQKTKDAIPVEERRLKLENNMQTDPQAQVTIIQVQWWEREDYYRVASPFEPEKVIDLSEEKLQVLKTKIKEYKAQTGQDLPFDSVKATRRVYKQAFIGGKILKKGPCPRADGFTLNCITGELHKTKGTFFGIVTMVRDPQMMANKWLSQATHIINTTAKGGIIAEEDAFVDVREAQATWARPDAVALVRKGAITGNKIMAKPGTGLAAPYVQLMGIGIDAIPQVTGINMELMGLRDAQQPGVLEAQRKQAAMTILATMFDSLKGFRMEVGKTRLHFIQNYLADGRLIRIIGPNGHVAVKLMKDRVVGEYDVVVSDAPTSPNSREMVWAAIQPLISNPRVQEMMTPEVVVALMEYIPGVPAQLISLFKEMIAQPNPQAEQAAQLEFQGKVIENEKGAAAAEKDRATAEKTRAQALLEMIKANSVVQAAQPPPELPKMNDIGAALAALGAGGDDQIAIGPMSGDGALPQLPSVPVRPPAVPPQAAE